MMRLPPSKSLLICLLLAILLIARADAAVSIPQNETFPALIVFGDSIVDAGNNNYLKTIVKCNFPPYGVNFEGGVPTGRFCNGKIPSDLLAQELGIKELLPPYLDPNLTPKDLLTGVTFASGASGYDPLTSRVSSALSLSDQLRYFKEYVGKLEAIAGKERADFILGNSLYAIITGSNDITNTYYTLKLRKQYDIAAYTDLMLNGATQFIGELYGLGARRMAVASLPPEGCLPVERTLVGGLKRGCSEKYNDAANLFNSKLSQALAFLSTSLTSSKLVYMDIYSILMDLIQNPIKYGFEITTEGCCGTGLLEVSVLCNKFTSSVCPNVSTFLFWDSFHPTERAYKIIVLQFIKKYLNKLL